MADDRHYVGGDWYQLDDFSGFKIRASRSRKIPGGQTGGAIVDPKRWEPQHPQDFVRGVVDDQTVRDARPRQKDRFTIVATFVTAHSPRLSRSIQVDSIEGFVVNHKIAVMLDSGENYYPTILAISGNTLYLSPVLPHGVGGNFGDPIENTIIDLGPSDLPPWLVDDARTLITDEEADALSVSQ